MDNKEHRFQDLTNYLVILITCTGLGTNVFARLDSLNKVEFVSLSLPLRLRTRLKDPLSLLIKFQTSTNSLLVLTQTLSTMEIHVNVR